MLEYGKHNLTHICLESQHLQDLHHEFSQSFSLKFFINLDLVYIKDLVIEIHVVTEMRKTTNFSFFIFSKEIPSSLFHHLGPFIFLAPTPVALFIEGLHIFNQKIDASILLTFIQIRNTPR